MTYQFKVWLADYRTGKVDTTTDPIIHECPTIEDAQISRRLTIRANRARGIVCSPIVREEAGKLL